MDAHLPQEAWQFTAKEIINAVRQKKISISEIINSCLKRIEKVEYKVSAWEFNDPELVIKHAKELDERFYKNQDFGILLGVPIGVKDIFNTAEMPTCMGSRIWKNFTPGNDARVVFDLQEAGGIIMGKTVTAEFAVHHPGKTVNPYNNARIPGTSSSGSAVAVAAGMVPLAIGSQTAGSTIRPASYCGVYGYKPSFGLIPRTGILKTLDTLDHVTCFTRCVDDIILFLDAARVKGKNYPYVYKNLEKRLPVINSNKEWRLGFIKTPTWTHAERYVKTSMTSFLKKIESHPVIHLEEVELPSSFSEAHAVHKQIYMKALSYYFQYEYENHFDLISPVMRDMIEEGNKITHKQYLQGLKQQNALSADLNSVYSKYDILISHSTAGDAPLSHQIIEKDDPCLLWTLCRVPSINLPVFTSPKNMPFGAQITAKRYNDYHLLNFAKLLYSENIVQKASIPDLS